MDTRPFLRDAAVTLVPLLTDDQLHRIAGEVRSLSSFVLVSRLSLHTLLIQGIPVLAETHHEADTLTWEKVNARVCATLTESKDVRTRLTAIDVREPAGVLV